MWVKNGFISLFTTGVSVVVLILCLPYTYGILNNSDLGFYTNILLINGIIVIFDMGLCRYNVVYYANNTDKKVLNETVDLTIYSGIIGTAIYMTCIYIFAGHEFRREYFLLGLIIIPSAIISTVRGYYEGRLQFYKSNLIKLANNSIVVLAPIICYIFRVENLINIIYLILSVRYIIMLATLIQVKYKYTGQIISNIKIVKYSGWSLLIALLAPILMYFDRFYVSMNVEYSDLPIYSLPHEYIPKFVLITTAFSTALLPYFALNNNNAGAYNEFKKIFKKISIILIAPHILLFILSYLYFSHYIDENFANKIFPLLIIFNLSAYVNSLSSVAYNFVLSYNSIDDIAKNYIYQIILYIPILFFLYNLLGFSGAAIAYLLRNFLDLHMLLKNAKNNH